jgi:hypothetical protein
VQGSRKAPRIATVRTAIDFFISISGGRLNSEFLLS